jgi:hydroxypyruvate isomerase
LLAQLPFATTPFEISTMPNFAANLSMMFQEHAFLDRFEAAARAGFRGVEFLFPYEYPVAELRVRLGEHKLTQALFNLPPGDWSKGERGVAIFPGREAEFRGYVAQAIDYARELGCKQLHMMAGIVPAGADTASLERTYIENIRYAAAQMKAHGIRTLLEPLNTIDNPGYFLTSIEQTRRIMELVGSDNVYLQLDLYHRQMMQGNLAQTIEKHLPVSSHIQIAGVPGRHEPNVGEINYPFLFDLIDRLGYRGWIGCEYRPKGVTTNGLGWAGAYAIRASV